MLRAGVTVGTGILLVLALVMLGCGDSSTPQPPSGSFADALATIGGGGANGSLGVGWADPQLVRRAKLGRELIEDALGPNAGTVIEAAPWLRREFGLAPLAARRLISVGGSYAFGLRVDGVGARKLDRRLVEAGGDARRVGRLELVNVGSYAVVPRPLLRSGVTGLGAFDAFGRNLTVLSISDTARDALLGRGARLIDEPTYAAAARCLGKVVTARVIPDNLLLSTDLGINAVAIGVPVPTREVLCILGGTRRRAGEVASALRRSLRRTAREPVTGEPIRDSVAAVHVRRNRHAGVQVVRARLKLAGRRSSGFLFETVSHGSLVSLINGR